MRGSEMERLRKRKVQIIDLSVPLTQTPPGSMLKVEIEYIKHKDGTKIFGSFLDSKKKISPRGTSPQQKM